MTITLLTSTYFAFWYRKFSNKNQKIRSYYFLFLVIFVLVFVAGLRENIGDTYVYIQSYRNLANKSISDIINTMGDWGYYLFTLVLFKISTNPQFMIFINALLTQILYIEFFKKYKTYFELSIFMYISSGYYFVTMNGLRQSLAAGVIVFATKYIIESNFKKYVVYIIFASLIHQSALIMIILYPIVKLNPWSKKVFLLIGLAVIGVLGFYEFLPILEKIIKGTNYEHYIQVFVEGIEEGANPLRVLVALVPVVLAFLLRDRIENSLSNKIFINFSIINLIFMIFSLQTWIFARFTIYFNLYNCVFLPYLINKLPNKNRKIIIFFFLVLYLGFFLREQLFAERIRFCFK